MRLALPLIAALSLAAAPAYKASVTISHTLCGSSDSSNFPILVKISGTPFKSAANGGVVQNANGYDVTFWSDAALSSALTWEIDYYDQVNGVGWFWYKGTCNHSTDQVVYFSWGDPTISTFQSTATSVWSNSYDGVWHMSGDSSTVRLADSTTNANNGTNHSSTAGAGEIAGAGAFASASSQYVALTDAAALQPTTLTLSVWIKSADASHTQESFRKRTSGYYQNLTVTGVAQVQVFDSGGNQIGCGSHAGANSSWHYIVLTFDATSSTANALKCYFDNNAVEQANAVSTGNIKYGASAITIGADSSGGTYWNGSIDELHVATGVRSADWITAEYNNQSSPTTFAVIGPQQIAHGALLALGMGN